MVLFKLEQTVFEILQPMMVAMFVPMQVAIKPAQLSWTCWQLLKVSFTDVPAGFCLANARSLL